jgi:hypothetical protein
MFQGEKTFYSTGLVGSTGGAKGIATASPLFLVTDERLVRPPVRTLPRVIMVCHSVPAAAFKAFWPHFPSARRGEKEVFCFLCTTVF